MIYKLYIGSNNQTKKLEKKRAVDITSSYFEGFSVSQILGYWKGKAEKTLLIEIETIEKNKVLQLSKTLAQQLQQQAIGVIETSEKMQFLN
ncbi:MAG: hypothetical protein WC917_02625 [Bacilli bacterium]|jgi:hypothetical protein